VTGQHRATQRHEPVSATPEDPDAALRSWLRQYAKDHPRRGFRPAYHDARGQGWRVNHKKIQRLWREEGLRVPQRRRRKRGGTSTAEVPTADAPNRVWAADFQFDVTTDGRPIKIVSIIDEHTRECLGGLVERNITGENLIGELDRLAGQRGTYPAVLRCDNGPELACSAMADWAHGQVGLHFIPPGEPWRNGYVESFNSASATNASTSTASGHWRRPASSSATGNTTTTTNAIPPWATNPQPATPPTAPTDNLHTLRFGDTRGCDAG
jgi:putative transposase